MVTANLETEAGWVKLTDLCEEHPRAHLVVNTRGSNLDGLINHSTAFLEAIATDLRHRVVMLWVINEERDSAELMLRYIKKAWTPHVRLHVACNRGRDRDRSFTFYQENDASQAVKAQGGLAITIPTLGKAASTELYTNRRQITEVIEDRRAFRTSVRTMMRRWRTDVWQELDKLELVAH